MPNQFPSFVTPQLATLVGKPPVANQWIYEIKFDGYRGQLAVAAGNAIFYTRGGLDWSEKFPGILNAATRLKVKSALIDGEAVALDAKGRSDFSTLQDALSNDNSNKLIFYAFDLLELNGKSLLKSPLIERKALLFKILAAPLPTSGLLYSEHIIGDADALHRQACRLGLEGIVAKRGDQPYKSGRSKSWLKMKCTKRQEFVVGGWLPRSDEPNGVGALLVGYFDKGVFKYAGRVGTGFNQRTRAQLVRQLTPSLIKQQPFQSVPRQDRSKANWTTPKMVIEVEFTEFTAEGMIRHPSFKGIREDKRAGEVHLELPRAEPTPTAIENYKSRWRRPKRQ